MYLLRLPQVLGRTGMCRSTLYQLMERGDFPRPCKLGPRCNAWPANEIDDWIAERLAARAPGRP
jgi:prophage regulatory protein